MSTDTHYRPGDVVNGHRLSEDGTRWIPVAAEHAQAAGQGHQNWFSRHKVLTGVIGAGALFLTVGVIGSAGEDSKPSQSADTAAGSSTGAGAGGATSSDAQAPAPAPAPEKPAVQKPAEEPTAEAPAAPEPAAEKPVADEPAAADPGPQTTVSQDNALRAAQSYLEFSHFSKQGLIDQLSSEYGDDYSVADATWAVSQLNVDWNEQAVGSAESYLEFSAFSRSGLIDQLSSEYGDQYTVAQATYAADKVGL